MNIEDRLRGLRPRKAPDEILERARSGRARNAPFRFMEVLMAAAAAALLAALFLFLPRVPQTPIVTPAAPQDDAWFDREAKPEDLADAERKEIEKLVADLGSTDQASRDAASKALEARLESAIGLVRQATKSEDAEVAARAKDLLVKWEKSIVSKKLGDALARARKDAKPQDDWKAKVDAALAGDAGALAEVRKAGWESAPLVADAGAKLAGSAQIKARALLRELLGKFLVVRKSVHLAVRAGNGAYGDSAYSFRSASQDLKVHHNYVDLVYNTCGLIHINAHGGMKSRIADSGAVPLETVEKEPAEGWLSDCFKPVKGHVYVQEVVQGRVAFFVKFVVTDVGAGTVDLEWTYLGDAPKPMQSNPGMPMTAAGGMSAPAGTMGNCGGAHEPK